MARKRLRSASRVASLERVGDTVESNALESHEPLDTEATDNSAVLNDHSAPLSFPLHSADNSARASPLASSAETSMTEAPLGTSDGGVSKQKKSRSLLGKQIEILQKQHLWMGGDVPAFVITPGEPPVRVTRRMAARMQTAAAETRPSVSHSESAASQLPGESLTESPKDSAVTSSTQDVGPGTAAAEETRDHVMDDKSAGPKKQLQKSNWRSKASELHPDHVFFERLRYVPLVSHKAPVATEHDVICSSAQLHPRPLVMFANLLLAEAPELLLRIAGKQV